LPDVAIVGGGPAGASTALSLAQRAPSLSVTVVEGSGYDSLRAGETLAPVVRPMLQHLGVWDELLASDPIPVHGSAAAWGSSSLQHNEYVYMAHGCGWHVDRTRFDGLLARCVERRGVHLVRETRVGAAHRAGEGWELELSNGERLRARFVVDATGSGAAFARGTGARRSWLDRLVAFGSVYEGCVGGEPHTLVEAFSDGWWYSATLPGGRRVVTCMTDADWGRELRLRDASCWEGILRTTKHARATVAGARRTGERLVRPAASHRHDPPVGPGWVAVGDAASAFDPLSSQGIAKAVRGGIFASYAVADWLVRGDERGLQRYRRFVEDEFDAYTKTWAKYYASERRWPDRPFWSRRHSPARGPA
jgi:2-polyprenyl-6-methoxyphenol hydroxylase-like FAD-dependent oxidoreductase